MSISDVGCVRWIENASGSSMGESTWVAAQN